MIRGIEARVRKLEAKRHMGDGAFYLAWGRDEGKGERTVALARAAGIVRPGDMLVSALWTAPEDMPASRWIRSLDDLSDAELDAFIALVRVEYEARGAGDEQAAAPSDLRLAGMTEVRLFAATLGVPVQ